jgi:hypothetical protein
MPYDVFHQLAGDGLRRHRQVVEVPDLKLLPDAPTGVSGRLGVLEERPGGHPAGGERVGTRGDGR